MTNIAERTRGIIADHYGVDAVEDDAHLYNDLGADSLDEIELSMSLEVEFGIEILDEDRAGIQTVGDVVKLMERMA